MYIYESNNPVHGMLYMSIDLGPAEDKVKFISNGDSTLLPCAINASNNVYPAPDGIEWRKDDRHLEDEVNIYAYSNGIGM